MQKRPSQRHITMKMSKIKDNERILKAVRGKEIITYKKKKKTVRLTADFSAEILSQEGVEWYIQSLERGKKSANQKYLTQQSYPSVIEKK